MSSSDPQTSTKKFPIIATLVAFLAIVIMLGLGFWQLDRKAQKELRLEQIEQAAQSGDIDLSTALQNPRQYEDFSLYAKGRWIDKVFYIDNKLHQGRPGFYIIMPLMTDNGILLVNLGWLAVAKVRGALPEFTKPQIHSVESVKGLVYFPSNNALVEETNARYGKFPALLQQVDLAQMQQHLNQQVLPFIIRVNDNNDSKFVREWRVVTMSPEKHLGYAVQWFGLAVAALTVYLLSLLKWMHGPQISNKSSSNKKD